MQIGNNFFLVFPVLERASASERGRVKCNSLGNQDEANFFYPFPFHVERATGGGLNGEMQFFGKPRRGILPRLILATPMD